VLKFKLQNPSKQDWLALIQLLGVKGCQLVELGRIDAMCGIVCLEGNGVVRYVQGNREWAIMHSQSKNVAKVEEAGRPFLASDFHMFGPHKK
jgi:hypothetical protein